MFGKVGVFGKYLLMRLRIHWFCRFLVSNFQFLVDVGAATVLAGLDRPSIKPQWAL